MLCYYDSPMLDKLLYQTEIRFVHIGQQLIMLRIFLSYIFSLEITHGTDLLYDFFKPHIYLAKYEIFVEAGIE